MKAFKQYFFAILFATTIGGAAFATIPTAAQAAKCDGKNVILTLPAWYRNLAEPDDKNGCRIINPAETPGGSVGENRSQMSINKFIWTIVLNIVDMMLQIIGYIAVGFIIYGGFLFLTSAGSPDGAAKGRKTILNAVIGLVLAIASVAIVNIIAEGLNI